ncbi:MAG TPA: DNA recombination protein RmuC, partial [Ramlibacter sp.]|nr:DNA recombination protein RmuC [Ramlibacter sp.]
MELWLIIGLAAANLVLLLVLLLRRPAGEAAARVELLAANERLERELRREVSESARGVRTELTQTLATFQDALVRQGGEA